jgi:hypothetical protein
MNIHAALFIFGCLAFSGILTDPAFATQRPTQAVCRTRETLSSDKTTRCFYDCTGKQITCRRTK